MKHKMHYTCYERAINIHYVYEHTIINVKYKILTDTENRALKSENLLQNTLIVKALYYFR